MTRDIIRTFRLAFVGAIAFIVTGCGDFLSQISADSPRNSGTVAVLLPLSGELATIELRLQCAGGQ